MILTKKQYRSRADISHGTATRVFRPNEVTPEQCHEIGLKLAKEMWGDNYQIIVTTHLDKEHLHNHFCFNSVSFTDGRKYNYSKSEQKRCVMYRTDYAENMDYRSERPKKAPVQTALYLDEKSGKPTRYHVYLGGLGGGNQRQDIPHMMKYLADKG